MKVIICAVDPADRKLASFAARSFPAGAPEILGHAAFVRAIKKKAAGAFCYIDLGLGDDKILDLASRLESIEDCGWGVLDTGSGSRDPAAFFFAGASDYVGPGLFKEGLGPGRLDEALGYAGLLDEDGEEELDPDAEGRIQPGSAAEAGTAWSSLKEGSDVKVRFCYAAIGNQKSLLERIGDKRLGKLIEDFSAFLESWSKDCGGIVWIRESAGCLLLFPPQDEGVNPLLAAFRLLLNRTLIGYEAFKLEVPLSFRFAFHAGRTMWKKPGATGDVVSEDVNFAFHLGLKAAADGQILVSADAQKSIPPPLRDLFSPGGDFEGRALMASRKFRD